MKSNETASYGEPPATAPLARRVSSRIASRRPSGTVLSPQQWAVVTRDATRSADRYALFAGDAVEVLRQLPDACINTCVTSPPYWKARDYGIDGQIGNERELKTYVERVVAVMDETYRVLRPDGSVWLNIGDVYYNESPTEAGRPPRHGWKRQKQQTLVPFRVALELQEAGWWVRNVLVWHKPNAMPLSALDRLASTWEPVFLLTKSPRYYFDLDAVRVPHLTDDAVERDRAERGANSGKANGKSSLRAFLTSPRHRATIDGLKSVVLRPNAPEPVELAQYLRDAMLKQGLSIRGVASLLKQPFERIRHYFRTDGIGSRLPPEETWQDLKRLLKLDKTYDARMETVVQDNVFRHHPNGRNPGDMLSVALRGSSDSHFAMMPLQLAEWCLRSTLPSNGTCLDPFMGTATSGVAAMRLGGRFVGIDLDSKCMRTAERRLKMPTAR